MTVTFGQEGETAEVGEASQEGDRGLKRRARGSRGAGGAGCLDKPLWLLGPTRSGPQFPLLQSGWC